MALGEVLLWNMKITNQILIVLDNDFNKKINWSIVDLQYCVSFYCTSVWISYTGIYSFLFFSHTDHYKVLSRVPVLISYHIYIYIYICICIYMYSSVFLSIQSPDSSLPMFPLVTYLFSGSVTLLLFCKQVHLYCC